MAYYYGPPQRQKSGCSSCFSCLLGIFVVILILALCVGTILIGMPGWATGPDGSPKVPDRLPREADVNPTVVANAQILTERGVIWVGQQDWDQLPPEIRAWIEQLRQQAEQGVGVAQQPTLGVPRLEWDKLAATQAPLQLSFGQGISQDDQEWFNNCSKVIYEVFGTPWPVEGRVVSVAMRVPQPGEEGAAAYYESMTDSIVVFQNNELLDDEKKHIMAHELTHAYTVVGPNGDNGEMPIEWLEGWAQLGGWLCDDTFYNLRDAPGQYLHEGLNRPEIGFVHSSQWMPGTGVVGLLPARYGAAGQAFLEIWAYDQSFFKQLGEELARRYSRPDDPQITREELWDVARTVQPKVDQWMGDEYIMSPHSDPALDGQKLWWVWEGRKWEQLPEDMQEWIPQGTPAFAFNVFYYDRQAGGEEVPLSGNGTISFDGGPPEKDPIIFEQGTSFGALLDFASFQSLEISIGGQTVSITKAELEQMLEAQRAYEPRD